MTHINGTLGIQHINKRQKVGVQTFRLKLKKDEPWMEQVLWSKK